MNKDTFDKPLSLLELNSLVAAVVDISLPDEYWVEAELSEAREVRGHCYMELVEKDEFSTRPRLALQPSAGHRAGRCYAPSSSASLVSDCTPA